MPGLFAMRESSPGKVWIDFEWFVHNHGSDPDNIAASAKYIMDGFVKGGVLTKDSLMVIQSPVVNRFRRAASKPEEIVIVTISDHPIWRLEPVD
jgi:hypothetical protein